MKSRNQRSLLLALAGVGLYVGVKLMARRKRYDLHGKVAIITGGSRGLGLVIARHLAARGARLVICSRTQEQLETARLELKSMGADVLAHRCDVTDSGQVAELINATISQFGKIDIIINNAGLIQVGPMKVMTENEYEEAMNIHFWAPLYTTLEALPHFRARKEGRIVNIVSIGGRIAVPHLLPYSASKFALMGLSEGLETELRKENIQVFTIAPSLMRTGSPRNITVRGDHEKEYALFKTVASLPLFSEDPEIVALKIIEAIESNETRPVISGMERMVSIGREIAPHGLAFFLSQLNRLLPGGGTDGLTSRKGYESESKLSGNRVARRSDADAIMNNEM